MPPLRFIQTFNSLFSRSPFNDPDRTIIHDWAEALQAECVRLQTTADNVYCESFIHHAVGGDLDMYGVDYDVPRLPAEADAAYRVRLLAAMRARGDAITVASVTTALNTLGATYTPTTTVSELAEWYRFIDRYTPRYLYSGSYGVYRWQTTSDQGYLTFTALMDRIPTATEAAAMIAAFSPNRIPAQVTGNIGRLRPPTIDATTPATTAVSVPLGDVGWRLDKTVDNLVVDDAGFWITGTNTNVRCTYDFGAGAVKKMVRFRILNLETAAAPTADFKHIKIEASNDGATWTKIPIIRWLDNCTAYNGDEATLAQATTLGMWADMILDPEGDYYRYWSIWVYDNWGNASIGTGEVEWMEDSQFDPMYIKQYASAYTHVGSSQQMWADNFYRAAYPAVVTDYYDLLVGGAVWAVDAYGAAPNGALVTAGGAPATTYIIANRLVAPTPTTRTVTTLEDALVDSNLEIADGGAGWIGFCLRYDATSGKYYAVGFDGVGAAATYYVYYYNGAAYSLLTSGAVGAAMDGAGGVRVRIWLEKNRLTLQVGAVVLLNRYECAGLHTIRGRWGFIKYGRDVNGKFDSIFSW